MAIRPDCHVYFIRRADGVGRIKIGCSQNSRVRLLQLAAWSPEPLEVVAFTPGDERLEKRLHALFLAHHSHGEWFHPAPALLRLIERVRDGTFTADEIPENVGPLPRTPREISPARKARLSVYWRIRRAARAGLSVPADIWNEIKAYPHDETEAETWARVSRAERFLASAEEAA